MAVSREDMREIVEECDKRYRSKDDCDEISGAIEKKLANDNTRFAVLEYQQKVNNWLTTAIAGGIVALLIKIFVGGGA